MMDKIIDYVKEHGIDKNSYVLNITHIDLDGLVSTINLKNFFNEVFYVERNYDKINDYFRNVLFTGNHSFEKPDIVIVTDISVEEEILDECEERNIPIIILDHHETAYHLNARDNCYVDEGDELSGAGVTLEFIKRMGYTDTKLDKLNKIANEFDLFLFKRFPELRKFDVCGKKLSLAEMLNFLFFRIRNNEEFIKRWIDGWGKGFTKQEIEWLKDEQRIAKEHIEKLVGNPQLEINLDEDKVLIMSYENIIAVADYYLDTLDKQLLIFFDHTRGKFSGRVNDNGNINIGKIFKLLKEKYDYIDNGGGHEKAGGGNIVGLENFEEFIDNVVKLADYYARKN